MKKFSAKIQYVTIARGNCTVTAIEETPVTVCGEDRNEAIRKACDVGQAIARSANDTNFGIFFRLIDVVEIGVA